MNTLFTHRNEKEGKVGIGKVPNDLHSILDDISKEYIYKIPDKSSTTHHTYYNDLTGKLKENFDKIQYDNFWNNISEDNPKCIKQCVIEMNEIYYSNPKPNFETHNLYGAAANLIPHRDCILYNFRGICFYRIIIGLTDSNNDTSTVFINFNLEHKINRGDYMIFDFDKTLHQVKKTGQQETPRILLKLHYIVCENGEHSENYVRIVALFYKYYYYVARYTEQIGTDPKTFLGFFFGLLWEWPFYKSFTYITVSTFTTIAVTLSVKYDVVSEPKNVGLILSHSASSMFFIYLVIVNFYYFRYLMFNTK